MERKVEQQKYGLMHISVDGAPDYMKNCVMLFHTELGYGTRPEDLVYGVQGERKPWVKVNFSTLEKVYGILSPPQDKAN